MKMDFKEFLNSMNRSHNGRVPTREELMDFVTDQSDVDKAHIAMGTKSILFNPRAHSNETPFSIGPRFEKLPDDKKKFFLDFSPIRENLFERNPELIQKLAMELPISMSINPDRVLNMMNEVRAVNSMAKIIEPDIDRGSYSGMVISQCATQSILRTESYNVVLNHDNLNKKPPVNVPIKVNFKNDHGIVEMSKEKERERT